MDALKKQIMVNLRIDWLQEGESCWISEPVLATILQVEETEIRRGMLMLEEEGSISISLINGLLVAHPGPELKYEKATDQKKFYEFACRNDGNYQWYFDAMTASAVNAVLLKIALEV